MSMDEEQFRRSLDDLGPPSAPAGLDTDAILGLGRRAARGRRIRRAVAAAAVVAAVPAALTLIPQQGEPETAVDLPPSPPSSRLTREAVEECSALVRSSQRNQGEPAPGILQGLAQSSTEDGTTVLVGNDNLMWTCNVDPDQAVTSAEPALKVGLALRPTNIWNFQVTHTTTSNVLPGARGDMVWAGGNVPDAGTTQILYHFPDGHTEPAVIHDHDGRFGFWVMQYFSPEPLETADNRPISVEVLGSTQDPEWSINLEWGRDTCKQVTHGC